LKDLKRRNPTPNLKLPQPFGAINKAWSDQHQLLCCLLSGPRCLQKIKAQGGWSLLLQLLIEGQA